MAWDRHEIRERIQRASKGSSVPDPQQLAQLVKLLPRSEPEEVFEGLLSLFTIESDRRYPEQELAGSLLVALKPSPRRPLPELLRQVLRNYELSVEQLPQYLADQFGRSTVLEALDQIETSTDLSEAEHRSAATFRYWLRSSGLARIRSATVDDAEPIGKLITGLGYPTTTAEMADRLTAILSDPNYATFVATQDANVIGVAGSFYERCGYSRTGFRFVKGLDGA